MLKRHSVSYLVARGVPALVSFLMIAVLTRLMSADAYGKYKLVVAGVGFAGISFQWLRLSLLRFLPAYQERTKRLFSIFLTSFLLVSLVMGGMGLISLAFIDSPVWRALVAIAIPLLLAKGWYEINLGLIRSRLDPEKYGWLRFTKVGCTLTLGTVLVLVGLGPFGPLIGLIVGMFVAGVAMSWQQWDEALFSVKLLSSDLSKNIFQYGFPLTASFAVSYVLGGADRLIIGWLLNESSAGIYSAAYDLAKQTITTLMMIVNLAAYPLAVNALEQEGKEAAYTQIDKNGGLLIAIGLPAAIGVSLLSPELSMFFMGDEFRQQASSIIPWIAAGTFLSGIRSYHFDMAFQLGNKTLHQVWILGIPAIVNVVINILFVVPFGILGAAWSTILSYAIALILSVIIGRRVFRVPLVPNETYKALFASTIMGTIVYFIDMENYILSFLVKTITGLASYTAIMYGLDFSILRKSIRKTR